MSQHSFPAVWLMLQCFMFLGFAVIFDIAIWLGDRAMFPFAVGAGVLCIAAGLTWLVLVRKP